MEKHDKHDGLTESLPDSWTQVGKIKKIVDMVNSPPHYNQRGIECIDAIAASTAEGYQYYLQGNIIKYIWRYRYKNGVEDLKKAKWYLEKLIDESGDDS